MPSFEEPEIFDLLTLIGDRTVEADFDCYPNFLASNSDYHPVFLNEGQMYVALDYIIMYPKVHVHKFREKEINEQTTINMIQ